MKYLEVTQTDYALIESSLLNKGTGFSEEERSIFKLHGLIPPYVSTIEEQSLRCYTAFRGKSSDIEKYIYLSDLQNSNETLFYNLIVHHIEEMLPIIYTPTVGEGCLRFSQIYRRPRGLFLSYLHRHRMDEIFACNRFDSVEVIVVSDGERILGLGDQGVGGMGIAVGKLALYTACAGVHPRNGLPIILDVGTDNENLLQDPLYLGSRHKRLRGTEYQEFIELFITAVKKRFPKVLLHWEDFAQRNALPLLQKYRDTLCSFNDDIQGTAAVAVGVLLAAISAVGKTLTNQKIVIVGSGSAGCGIAQLLLQFMKEEGLSEREALNRLILVDRLGPLKEGQLLQSFQEIFAKGSSYAPSSLLEVIDSEHPTALIGVSGQGGIFTEEVVRKMGSYLDHPIILPLSNPTKHSEATPSDLIQWTEGRVVLGTGSPFPDVEKRGEVFRVDQINNAYIFPGIGLGVIAIGATKVTDRMFVVAAKTLASMSPSLKDSKGNLLPPLKDIRGISFKIAIAVAKEAILSGQCPSMSLTEIEEKVRGKIWEPLYIPYRKAP